MSAGHVLEHGFQTEPRGRNVSTRAPKNSLTMGRLVPGAGFSYNVSKNVCQVQKLWCIVGTTIEDLPEIWVCGPDPNGMADRRALGDKPAALT
jgi:hypothetical protein